MNLWEQVARLQDKQLFTLDKKKPFEIKQITNNRMILFTSTDSQRPLPLRELERAWRHLERHKQLTGDQVRKLGYSNFNPAYVVAILANFPGVAYETKPIILRLKSL